MTLEADSIIARRRLRRSLAVWRILAVVALAAAVVAFLLTDTGVGGLAKRAEHIARIEVDGLITGSQRLLELIEQIEKAEQVKAVIVRIDSPGGTTAGSEALYLSLRRLADKKPLVAVMDTVAASGGYITALAADHIVARGNTITGSVGVIFQWAQVQELLSSLGIAVDEIKSGDLKAEPSPFDPMSQEQRQVVEQMVEDSFHWFLGLVEERRKLSSDSLRLVSDGRVFTGRQAVAEDLVDEIGGEEEAKAWLAAEHGVSDDLDIREWKVSSPLSASDIAFSMLGGLLRAFGFAEGSSLAQKIMMSERVRLDGLVSVWHPGN